MIFITRLVLIGFLVATLTIINTQYAYADHTHETCTSFKVNIIEAGSREDLAERTNTFMQGKDVWWVFYLVWDRGESMYIGYCEKGIDNCKDVVEPIATVGHAELMERINLAVSGKQVKDVLIAVGYQRAYVYIWYCEPITTPTKSTPKPSEPIPQPTNQTEAKLEGKIMTSDPVKLAYGDMIGIQTEVSSNMTDKKNFAYIVQIKDEFQSVVSLTWVENIGVLPNDYVKPSMFWLPEQEGKYTAQVFLWESVDSATPIAPMKSVSFEV